MDLSEQHVNVRKATRVLAGYYRRLLHVLASVERTLEEASSLRLSFLRWDGIHHENVGRQTTDPVSRWGWDFLPLSWAWFRWTTDGKPHPIGPGSAIVAVQHEVDSGYRQDGTEPDPMAFESPKSVAAACASGSSPC